MGAKKGDLTVDNASTDHPTSRDKAAGDHNQDGTEDPRERRGG